MDITGFPFLCFWEGKDTGITKLTQLLLYSDYQICMLFYYNQLDSGLQIGNFCKMILLNDLYASLNYLHRYWNPSLIQFSSQNYIRFYYYNDYFQFNNKNTYWSVCVATWTHVLCGCVCICVPACAYFALNWDCNNGCPYIFPLAF